ncbi:MAG: hypothetical protein Q8Q09_24795 [Deltaproteobacteria bacterium]|nr:hypothetical protein [Deltaproteobacteria bacterium]
MDTTAVDTRPSESRWATLAEPTALDPWLRAAVALGQIATVYTTREVLMPRTITPFLLPIRGFWWLASVPFAWLLMLSAALVIVPRLPRLARAASATHMVLLCLAMLGDQTRAQPSTLCLAVLLLGLSWGPRVRTIALCYLATMWGYAGVHKLLSPGWFNGTAPWLLEALTKNPTPGMSKWFPWAIAGGELSLGVLTLFARTRKLAALGALALHGGILYALGPYGHRWNHAVWPWNITLALTAPLVLLSSRGSLVQSVRETSRALWPAIALFFLGPALWYLGLYPPYFAHHLYTEGLPTTTWCSPTDGCLNDRGNERVYPRFGVPLPSAVSTLRADFARHCARGDTLIIRDPRRFLQRRGQGEIRLVCAPQ